MVSWLRKDKSRIWSANLAGMRKVEHAERKIKELQDGSCRFNCRTGKACFAQGVEWAIGFLPDEWEDEYRKIQKEDE